MTPPSKSISLKLQLDFPLFPESPSLRFFPEFNVMPHLAPAPSFVEKPRLLFQGPSWSPSTFWTGNPDLLAQIHPPVRDLPNIQVVPAKAPVKSGWNATQIFNFVTDILLLIESLDAKGTGMVSNGGEGGCRYEEMAERSQVSKLMDKCLVKFEPDTRASVDLQLRKMEASNTESLITIFRLRYDKNIYKDEFPDNQVRVQGFQFTPPPTKYIPFDASVSPLTQMGYSLRYMVEPAGLMKIPFVGYPIFKIEAEPHPKLDLTKDFFRALGIDKPEYYSEVNTDPFKAPQTVRSFMRLMGHIESDDDKLQVVNINKLKGRPPLFDWLSFEKIDWVSRLREGSLHFPNFGTFNFTRKSAYEQISKTSNEEEKRNILDHSARFEIHGTQAKLNISLENIELADAHFTVGDQVVTLKGLRAGKIKTNIPGIKELIRQVKAGTFGLDKLHLEAENLFIDEIIIEDKKNLIKTELKNSSLQKLIFNGSSDISAFGLQAVSLDVQSSKLNTGFQIENARIPQTFFKREKGKEAIGIPRIEGGKTILRYSNANIRSHSSIFEDLQWTESQDASQLFIGSLSSSGSIRYEAPSGISFETKGSSKLQNIHLGYTPSGQMNAALELSGKVNFLKLLQNGTLQLNLTQAEFQSSKLSMSLRLNPETKSLEALQYRCELKIKNAEFGESQIGPVSLAPSSLREGQIVLNHESINPFEIPSIDISGQLDLHLQSITGKNESFNIPGLSVTGGIYGISLTGPAHFKTTPTGWLFERLETAQQDKLQGKAIIRDSQIIHDPHQVPGNGLRSWPNHQVVKTDIHLQLAELSIDNIGKIEFVQGKSETETENHLQNMILEGIQINNIQASGVAWAKFPLFYYMRGVFPQIGAKVENTKVTPSSLIIDRFSIERSAQQSETRIQGLQGEIYEVGGDGKFAKLHLPLLRINPQSERLIDTGDQPNEIDLYLIDKARGGYIKLQSVPRPLDSRRSRIIKP